MNNKNQYKQNKNHSHSSSKSNYHQPPFMAVSSRKEGQEFISKRKSKNYDKYHRKDRSYDNSLFKEYENHEKEIHSHSYSGQSHKIFSNS